MKTRILWASAIALAALTVSMVFGGATGAGANTGDNVIAGQTTTEDNETLVKNTNVSVPGCSAFPDYGLLGCGAVGIRGVGTDAGVYGSASSGSGVYGEGQTDGTGVFGESVSRYGVYGRSSSSGETGAGVYGEVNTLGSNTAAGVYGFNRGSGYGVRAFADDGVAVEADSCCGTALNVNGVAAFSRSGTVTISFPSDSATITPVSWYLTGSSIVLATLQTNLSGVWVQSAVSDANAGTVTIYLNKAPGTKRDPRTVSVAWFVLN